MNASTQVNHPVNMTRLPVMESFLTLQGEGYHSGKAAYFIRLGGCDVGCVWCDVKESWEAGDHPVIEVDTLVNNALESKIEIVVITGGEPFMYDLTELTMRLRAVGLKTHVETAGVYPITGYWDWICFSPKKFKPAIKEYYQSANELKVIVFNQSDLKWAASHAAKLSKEVHLFLQPEWSKREKITPLIIDYVKRNPKWRISLQSHKYIDIP